MEKEAQEDGELERPVKMLKQGYRDGQTSTLNMSNTSMLPTPPVFTSQSLGQSKGKQPSSSNSLVHEKGDPSHPSDINRSQQSVQQTNAPRLPAHPMRLRERAASLQTPPKVKRPAPKSSSHALQLKEHNVGPDTVLSPEKNKKGSHALFKTKDEPITGDLPFEKSKVLADMFYIGMPSSFF